jgi:hypothetical protein
MWSEAISFFLFLLCSLSTITATAAATTNSDTSISSLYSDVWVGPGASNTTRELWFAHACPWEETALSGRYHKALNSDAAASYASKLYLKDSTKIPTSLENKRLLFVGDSVVRQFAQAMLCRWQKSVEVDSPHWIYYPGTTRKPSLSCPQMRHCYLDQVKVLFKGMLFFRSISQQFERSCSDCAVIPQGFFRDHATIVRDSAAI